MKIDLSELSISKAHELLQAGDFSVSELVASYLENIKKNDSDIHAFLEVFDDVQEQAEKIDKEIKNNKNASVLVGIPFAIKDNILIKNRKCSAGSKILDGFVAPYDAEVIKRLKNLGAIFLGRTNMDEFAMGSSTENSAFGVTKNPYDKKRVPGGSSGGSTAGVASQECLVALGSDTGGSIRQPAGFCGVVGLKPTYGAVSRRGLIAMGSSLDQIGPIAKSVEDAEIVFNAIKGIDPMDSTTNYRVPISIENLSRSELTNFVIGVPKEFFSLDGENKGIDKEVVDNIKKAIDFFKNSGAKIKEVNIPSLDYALAVYYIIMPAEASSNLARFDGIKYGLSEKGNNLLAGYMKTRKDGFGGEVQRRILLGTYTLSAGYYDAYYIRAQKVRQMIREEIKNIFKEVDILLSPTSPTLPFKIGERVDDPIKMYLADIFTIVANLTGVPAVSVPCGMSDNGLPIGLQLIASWNEEQKLFELGKLFEKNKKS